MAHYSCGILSLAVCHRDDQTTLAKIHRNHWEIVLSKKPSFFQCRIGFSVYVDLEAAEGSFYNINSSLGERQLDKDTIHSLILFGQIKMVVVWAQYKGPTWKEEPWCVRNLLSSTINKDRWKTVKLQRNYCTFRTSVSLRVCSQDPFIPVDKADNNCACGALI